jgi:hypothetical protein
MPYIAFDAVAEASPGSRRTAASRGLEEDFPMTIEILYLTAQIHRWLNRSVARHLAAQAERLTR